ncbi:hypothetical protein L226DRAFT_555716 [Lentinus tigrinus ALCF2SS1-7]|uniref:uncharacterized protein n=1 Tax=Lentinus tigrinus ALCF2SS1-7 TaxID=1328758 RepID=UPI0011662379|nr:hypothetical protein L226DRAFT_555716 [Lentinus tigrinus ALCF2SS1-7]
MATNQHERTVPEDSISHGGSQLRASFAPPCRPSDVKTCTFVLPLKKLKLETRIPRLDAKTGIRVQNGMEGKSACVSPLCHDVWYIADLDPFRSTVKPDTLSPVWNELWKIKNVPNTATLTVEVNDKDAGNIIDDHIGKFTTSVTPGAKECTIESMSIRKNRRTFWLNIESTPSTDPKAERRQYIFDGPTRFSRHFSPTIGQLTNLNDARLYSTWKLYKACAYKAEQTIFEGPVSIAVCLTTQAGHRMLYAHTTMNGFGIINGPEDVFELLLHGSVDKPDGTSSAEGAPAAGLCTSVQASLPFAHRVKPTVYTYVIAEGDSLRFSETGAAFFVDFASKHTLHANCAPAMRDFGTYSPDPLMLPDLCSCLSTSSREELQPHVANSECQKTLSDRAGARSRLPDRGLPGAAGTTVGEPV